MFLLTEEEIDVVLKDVDHWLDFDPFSNMVAKAQLRKVVEVLEQNSIYPDKEPTHVLIGKTMFDLLKKESK